MNTRRILAGAMVAIALLAPVASAQGYDPNANPQNPAQPPAGGNPAAPNPNPGNPDSTTTNNDYGMSATTLWIIGVVVLALVIAAIWALAAGRGRTVERETVIDRDRHMPP